MESWQESWDSFLDLLTEHPGTAGGMEGCATRVGGKKVVWSGVFEKADLDELAPNVYIGLPPRQLSFDDGRAAKMDGISLPIAEDTRAAWSGVAEGAQIRFEAIIGAGGSPFPPISVKTFRSGRTLVTVRLSEGRLL